ncbi:hypothetical protein GGX14DRAFT_454552, partial [Mycena pura]
MRLLWVKTLLSEVSLNFIYLTLFSVQSFTPNHPISMPPKFGFFGGATTLGWSWVFRHSISWGTPFQPFPLC